MTVSNLGWRFFLVTLMLVYVSSKKMDLETFNKSSESTQNKQQYGTKITRHRGKLKKKKL